MVVAGRRKMSRAGQFLFGSVSGKILQNTRDVRYGLLIDKTGWCKIRINVCQRALENKDPDPITYILNGGNHDHQETCRQPVRRHGRP